MNTVFNLTYESSLDNICELNSSFDKAVLEIAYHGKNRNGSYISKAAFEDAVPTMFNCPVVTNYIREDDELGGHDMEVVKNDKGFRLVNLTHPVGVIPSEAKWFWTTKEDNGVEHEYLCADVLLWRREEAYEKIKEDGIAKHSMEITVLDSHKEDGIYCIDKFEFTAFCLLGNVEPCFEGSELITYSMDGMQEQFAQMMSELKESISAITSAKAVDDNKSNFVKEMEGGEDSLEEKLALLAEFGLNADELDFSLEDLSLEELREKFEAMKKEPVQEPASEENPADENFELNTQLANELRQAISMEMTETPWGEEMPRYWFVDFDNDAMEVYAEDGADGWKLVGMKYAMDGDKVVIDFETKTRKKYAIVDFDDGSTEQVVPVAEMFELIKDAFAKKQAACEEELEAARSEFAATILEKDEELGELRQFKASVEKDEDDKKRSDIFANFEDLNEVEAFKALVADNSSYSLEALEEKCYALRGRNGTHAKFSSEPAKAPKLAVPVMEHRDEDDRYGGIFEKYPPKI